MCRRGPVQLGAVSLWWILTNCREAQDQGKTFHYAWVLLSILLIVREITADNQFPTVEQNIPEAMRYTLL